MAKKKSPYADQIALEQKGMTERERAILQKERLALRKRAIERGLIQFRADQLLIEALLNSSELHHVPVGVFCRDIIWSYLQNQPGFITKETTKKSKKSARYDSPDGLVGKVSQDSDVEDLIDTAIENLAAAKKKLRKEK